MAISPSVINVHSILIKKKLDQVNVLAIGTSTVKSCLTEDVFLRQTFRSCYLNDFLCDFKVSIVACQVQRSVAIDVGHVRLNLQVTLEQVVHDVAVSKARTEVQRDVVLIVLSVHICPASLFCQEFHNVEESFGRGQVQGPVSNFSTYIDISAKLQKDTGYLFQQDRSHLATSCFSFHCALCCALF